MTVSANLEAEEFDDAAVDAVLRLVAGRDDAVQRMLHVANRLSNLAIHLLRKNTEAAR